MSNNLFKNFRYLLAISEAVGLKDSQGNNILSNRLKKINLDNQSILNNYLTATYPNELTKTMPTIIFPFGSNLSQKQAVENALTQSISVIEGPPGTGKTQTILNIIANLILQNKTIAVVSSNNSAITNIQEKLKKDGYDFLVALLGSSENKKDFIKNQPIRPNLDSWKLLDEDKQNLENKLSILKDELTKYLSEKNKIADTKKELHILQTEFQYFKQYYQDLNIPFDLPTTTNKSSQTILKLWELVENNSLDDNKLNWFRKIFYWFKYGIKNFSFYNLSTQNKIAFCQYWYYLIRLHELENSLSESQTPKFEYDFDNKMQELYAYSTKIFKNHIFNKYQGKTRNQFSEDTLWKNPELVLEEFPIILSTTYSLSTSLSKNTKFDYVIIDEASQVDIVTGALALSCAKNAVIVGDVKQLANVVTPAVKQATEIIFNTYKISDSYCYYNHSLLSSIMELFPNAHHVLLREHYRCHPQIIEFCNRKFYDNQLIVLTNETVSSSKPLVVYQTADGKHAHNHSNQRQIDVITKEIIHQQKLDINNDSIGIVTPYVNQTKLLQNTFAGSNVQVDTVDKFQGREKDVIIISTVDDEIGSFTDNPNRLNVAVSRAVKKLTILTSPNNINNNSNLSDLVQYVLYHDGIMQKSDVYSVFDYLYSKYNDSRMQLLKNTPLTVDSPAEALIYKLLKNNILNLTEFQKYSFNMHIPLKTIIRSYNSLTSDERTYLYNDMTHVDFLIFDKFNMQPKLVIEVDGISYHQEGSQQAARDELKNSILNKHNISYLRLRTNESEEKKRIIDRLRSI